MFAGLIFAAICGLYITPRLAVQASLPILLDALERPAANPRLNFLDDRDRPFDSHAFDNKLHDNLSLDTIDPEFIRDLLAVEDRGFYAHGGVDYTATLRAAGDYLLAPLGRLMGRPSGRRRGGSTITQQLIKNVLNHRRRTPWTKLKEIHLARLVHARLQDRLGGEKARELILTNYLNRLYITDRIRGLRNAAHVYLNSRDMGKLAPRERRLLLAILNAPGVFQKRDARRMRSVLRRIEIALRARGRRPAENGETTYYTGEAGARQRRVELEKTLPVRARTNFADSHMRIVEPRLGISETRTVRTHRVSALNSALDVRLLEYLKRINNDSRDGCAKTGAYILIRVKDGAVIASGDSPCDEYNETVQLRRQIHSTYKPILYATAFMELGVGPATIYRDKRVSFRDDLGRVYSPGNNYRIFKGPITLKRALQFSTNTISLQLLNGFSPHTLVGQSQKAFALYPGEKLRHQFHTQPSLALGTVHLSPAHLAAAYLTLLSGGLKKYPAWERGGSDAQTRGAPEQVLQKAASYQVREMLTAVVRMRGTGGPHLEHISGLIIKDLGGKSGSSPRDSWFAGFSQDLLLVAWVGYRLRLTAASKNFSAIPLWKRLFLETLPYYPPRALEHPSELRRAYYCKHSGQALTRRCPRLESALFPPGREPRQKCTLHPD